MATNSEIQCWTSYHIIWSVGIALPIFLLWGIILPLILLRKLMRSSKDLHNPQVYAAYAFVYVGIKSDCYYW